MIFRLIMYCIFRSFGVVLWEIVKLAEQPYQGKSNEEVLKFVLNGGKLEYPADCDKQMKEFMEMCWSTDPKLRPSFLEIIRLLEDGVSADFVECSFYHEMKRKALEDTLCQEGNLYELLARPLSTPRGRHKVKRNADSLSEDSGAFIESCKPEADQLNNRDSSVFNPVNSGSRPEESGTSTPRSNRSSRHSQPPARLQHQNSLYDNLDDDDASQHAGDTPVPSGSNRSDNNRGQPRLEALNLNKIFGTGKAVPV